MAKHSSKASNSKPCPERHHVLTSSVRPASRVPTKNYYTQSNMDRALKMYHIWEEEWNSEQVKKIPNDLLHDKSLKDMTE